MMSIASSKGKRLELEVAKLIRQKLDIKSAHRDKRSGAGATTRTDIKDFTGRLPLAIECKDQQTIKIKEWFRQADAAASYHEKPTVVFRDDENILATLRFADLLDLVAEVQQLRAQLDGPDELLLVTGPAFDCTTGTKLRGITSELVAGGAKTCKNEHISDKAGKCLVKGCPYSHGYHAKRVKK